MLPDRDLLDHLTQCFDDDEIETLIRVSDPSEPQTPESAAVKVVHRPTGIEVLSAEHTTQIRNKTVALARLVEMVLERTYAVQWTPEKEVPRKQSPSDPAERLASVLHVLAVKHKSKLDELKAVASLLDRDDAVWHLLLGSFATLGGGGHLLFDDQRNYDRVTFEAIKKYPAKSRVAQIEKTMRAAKVRYPARKAGQLAYNFDLVENMGGPPAARAKLMGSRGREGKIAFLKQFKGIGDKYGRNIMMDVYHPDFRDSVALDSRVQSITKALGLTFSTYEAEEGFYLDVARKAGVNGWTVDRLIYNFRDEVLVGLKA